MCPKVVYSSLISSDFIREASQVVLMVKNLPASAGDVRDVGSIPGSGRSPGEGIGYPLQYSWVSLVAQMVKNLPVMQKTQF